MSKQQAEAFVTKVLEDEELRDELDETLGFDDNQEEPSEEELRSRLAEIVPEVASDHGYEFTPEQGFEALATLLDDRADSELTDEELEGVAGGRLKSSAEVDAMSVLSIGIGCIAYSAEKGGGFTACKVQN